MSNDNLKERLTDMSVLASTRTTADALKYIEELEERLKAATDDAKEAEAYAGELEAVLESIKAKLAKALEALERIEDASKYFGNCPEASETTVRYAHETTRRLARTTLAELSSVSCANTTGGNDE